MTVSERITFSGLLLPLQEGHTYSCDRCTTDGMELLFFYRCPHCLRHVPLVNPVEPRNVRCDGCGKQFPIIPVDEHGLHYVRIMLANGKAAANPDYL